MAGQIGTARMSQDGLAPLDLAEGIGSARNQMGESHFVGVGTQKLGLGTAVAEL